SCRRTDVMSSNGFGEAADSAEFDVDDPACSGLDCRGGISGVKDGFVETQRGLQLRLETRMSRDVVIPKRLLDHQQVKLVELLEMVEQPLWNDDIAGHARLSRN